MTLGTLVGLGPGDIVLHGDPLSPKGAQLSFPSILMIFIFLQDTNVKLIGDYEPIIGGASRGCVVDHMTQILS